RPPLYTSRPPPRLHSFPTRRSSDLSRRGLQLAQRLLIANHARIAGIEVFADSRRRAEGRAFFQGCRRYFHSGDEIAVDPFYFLAGIMVWIDEIDNVGEHDLARKIAALEQQAR